MKKIVRPDYCFLPLMLGFSIVSFSQNITIGTSLNARAKLEVQGAAGSGYTSGIFGADGAGISLQRNWPTIGFNQYNDGSSKYMSTGYGAIQYMNPSTGILALDMLGTGSINSPTNSQFRAFTIDNLGNLGFGTGINGASLNVVKGSSFDGSAVFGGTNYNSHFHYSTTEDTYIRPGKSGGAVYINDQGGGNVLMGNGFSFVGINTSTPSFPLEIRQTGLTGLLLTEPSVDNNHWEMVVGFYNSGPESSLKHIYNGQLKAFFRPTDGDYITSSDRRIKTNINPLPSLLDKIMQLKPVSFELKYNNPQHKTSLGFIAQDVQKIFPDMVKVLSYEVTKGVTIPDFHSLDYNAFKIIAVKGVQEEQGLIEEQQSTQDDIKKRLEKIEQKLAAKK